MFLHHDRDWWALVISIVALAGAYPLSLLANLTSPSLKNWWAERSVAAIRERIQQLEKQLEDYEQYEQLTEGDDYILRATEALGMLFLVCTAMLALVLLSLLAIMSPTVRANYQAAIVALAITGPLFSFVVSAIAFGNYSTFRTKRSKRDREILRQYLNKLRGTLAQQTR
jgi:amino acid transporter